MARRSRESILRQKETMAIKREKKNLLRTQVYKNGVVKHIWVDPRTGTYTEELVNSGGAYCDELNNETIEQALRDDDHKSYVDDIFSTPATDYGTKELSTHDKLKMKQMGLVNLDYTKPNKRKPIQIKNPLQTAVMYSFRFPFSDGSFMFYTLADDGFYYENGQSNTRKSIDELLRMLSK